MVTALLVYMYASGAFVAFAAFSVAARTEPVITPDKRLVAFYVLSWPMLPFIFVGWLLAGKGK